MQRTPKEIFSRSLPIVFYFNALWSTLIVEITLSAALQPLKQHRRQAQAYHRECKFYPTHYYRATFEEQNVVIPDWLICIINQE